MSRADQKLRYLISCDAERLSDYQRINQFVVAGHEAVLEIERLREELRKATGANHVDRRETESALSSQGRKRVLSYASGYRHQGD